MISLRPSAFVLRRALGIAPLDLDSVSSDCWELAPAETRFVRPVIALPGQLERIRGVEFGSRADVLRHFTGGFEVLQDATLGFRVPHVDLVDGVLYKKNAMRHLRARAHRKLTYRVPTEAATGALYESWTGNRWFGNWMIDDCLTYPLAEAQGAPVTTTMTTSGHMARYEALLGHTPRRIDRAHFDELFIFRDSAQNTHRKARADGLRQRLISTVPYREHAGVFLLRGTAGARRILANELQLADRLAGERGFTIIDPMAVSVDEIIAACAGARVVAGVEGSQLVHGLMTMPSHATLLVIQPPERAVSVLKMTTDRQGQDFAILVGSGGGDLFSIEWSELDRTLDLITAK